jgi:hypothetical protein
MPTLWPLAVAVGLTLAVLAHLLPTPSSVFMVRVFAVVAFLIAAIVAIPGIAT